MRLKIYSTLLVSTLLFGTTNTSAQITIDDTEVAKPGTSIAQSVDEDPGANITAGSAGANMSWDFSSLSTTNSDTLFVVEAAQLGRNERFPKANLGYYLSNDNDSAWGFIESSSTEFKILGGAAIDETTGDTNAVDVIFKLLSFPSTFGTSFTNISPFVQTVKTALGIDPDGPGPIPFIDSLWVRSYRLTESNMDAWGSLTTPLGTFDVLRQKELEVIIDSTFSYSNNEWKLISPALATLLFTNALSFDTTWTYRWWSDQGAGFPLVDFTYDPRTGDPDDYVSWVSDIPNLPTGIATAASNQLVKLYPNPVSDLLIVDLNTDAIENIISVRDISGRIVAQQRLNNGKNSIDLSALPSGMYVYNILDEQRSVKTGKLILE